MDKSFGTDDLNQSLLFPPSLHDWLPDNRLAQFLADVVNALDLDCNLLVLQREGWSWDGSVRASDDGAGVAEWLRDRGLRFAPQNAAPVRRRCENS